MIKSFKANIRREERLTLETPAFKLFMVANLRY